MFDQDQLQRIQDTETRYIVEALAHHIEQALTDNDTLRAEVQRFKDESNRLKGEQGKPTVKASKKPEPASSHTASDHPSEEPRKQPKPWRKTTKNDKIVVDRNEVVPLAPADLPADARFKGYEAVLMQNLLLKTDNVCLRRTKYYSGCGEYSIQGTLMLVEQFAAGDKCCYDRWKYVWNSLASKWTHNSR